MYYTGLDPFTKEPVQVSRGLKDRKMQRALIQFFKAQNWFTVRKALMQAGRQDLIGSGCDCLIPAQPPKAAIEARRRKADQAARGNHVHEIPIPGARSRKGYRPGRKTATRAQKQPRGRASPPS